jgi:hypothetical protein
VDRTKESDDVAGGIAADVAADSAAAVDTEPADVDTAAVDTDVDTAAAVDIDHGR